jgi:hypothetical protein
MSWIIWSSASVQRSPFWCLPLATIICDALHHLVDCSRPTNPVPIWCRPRAFRTGDRSSPSSWRVDGVVVISSDLLEVLRSPIYIDRVHVRNHEPVCVHAASARVWSSDMALIKQSPASIRSFGDCKRAIRVQLINISLGDCKSVCRGSIRVQLINVSLGDYKRVCRGSWQI